LGSMSPPPTANWAFRAAEVEEEMAQNIRTATFVDKPKPWSKTAERIAPLHPVVRPCRDGVEYDSVVKVRFTKNIGEQTADTGVANAILGEW